MVHKTYKFDPSFCIRSKETDILGIIQQQAIRSTVYSYAGIVLGFFTTAWLMPQALNSEEVGLLRLLWSLTVVVVQFSNLGFNNAGIRYFPYFRSPDNNNHGFLFLSCAVSLLGFIFCLIIFSFNQQALYNLLNISDSSLLDHYLYSLVPLSLFTLYFQVFDNYAKATYDATTGTFWKEFGQRVLIALAIGLYFWGNISFDSFIVVWQVAICLPTLFLMLKIARDGNLNFKPDFSHLSPELMRGMLSLSLLTLLSGFTTQIVQYIDQIMVTSMKGLSDNGIYATMLMFGTVIAMPAQQIYRIAGTVIADAWRNNDLKTIREVYEKSCLTQLIIGALLFVGIIANLHNVFAILPPEYKAGGVVVLYVGLGKLFDMATGVNGVIVSTSRFFYYDTIFFVFLVVITTWLNYLLIPSYGIEGSAIATAISLFLFNTARTLFVWWKFGIQPFSFRNFLVLLLAGLSWWLINLLPVLPNLGFIPTFVVDTLVRSVLITLFLGGSIYLLQLSEDFNKAISTILNKLRRPKL